MPNSDRAEPEVISTILNFTNRVNRLKIKKKIIKEVSLDLPNYYLSLIQFKLTKIIKRNPTVSHHRFLKIKHYFFKGKITKEVSLDLLNYYLSLILI